MKLSLNIFMGLALAFVLAACEPASGTKIAFVDVQKVFLNSKAGKSLNKQGKTATDKIQRKRTPEQKRLERERKRLEGQRTTLSAASLQAKENAWRQKVIGFRQRAEEENKRLQAGYQESRAQIGDVLEQIYEEVRNKSEVDILLIGSSVLNGSAKTDLSDDVISILDERLSEVKLEIPKE